MWRNLTCTCIELQSFASHHFDTWLYLGFFLFNLCCTESAFEPLDLRCFGSVGCILGSLSNWIFNLCQKLKNKKCYWVLYHKFIWKYTLNLFVIIKILHMLFILVKVFKWILRFRVKPVSKFVETHSIWCNHIQVCTLEVSHTKPSQVRKTLHSIYKGECQMLTLVFACSTHVTNDCENDRFMI